MIMKTCCNIIKNLRDKTNWLSFISGFSLVFAYAPFSFWWITFLALLLFLQQIESKSCRISSKQGLIFGFGWFASGISWVHVSIETFGGMPLIASLFLMFLLCLYLAVYPALACYLSAKITKDKKLNIWYLLPFWILTEYLRSVLFTGFPWLSLGYSQINSPFSSYAPVIGEVGISFIVLLSCISLFKVIKRRQIKRHSLILISLTIGAVLLSQVNWTEPNGKKTIVALVQGNIDQSEKWAFENELPTMLTYLEMTRANYDADIIIWPESAITIWEPKPSAQDFLDIADQSANLNNSAIITGIINHNSESEEFFNSLIVLGNKQNKDEKGSYYYNNSNRYYKNHLLPIGEFVPFEELIRPIAPLFNLPMSNFIRGSYTQTNLVAKGLHILPLICFEIAFPEQLSSNLTNDTDILLTVSNDAWFGNSHGPHQHLDIARMRALEFGRPLLRATNNGVTAIVDHKGIITKQLPQFVQAVLKADVALVEGYTPYSFFGRSLTYACALLMLLLLMFKEYNVIPKYSQIKTANRVAKGL
jgi:apolipoprotein N-acyltransferase